MDIVHWPLNPEAPFQFSSTPQYTLHPKKDYDRDELKKLLAQINPTAIVCSGWMDSDYNAMAKAYCKLIPVVLTLDNWWTGSTEAMAGCADLAAFHPTTIQPRLGAR